MKDLEIIMNLGLTLNNGECLELIKKERGYIEHHIEQMKKDNETKFDAMKHKVNLLCAYNVLIESFEKYLGHYNNSVNAISKLIPKNERIR